MEYNIGIAKAFRSPERQLRHWCRRSNATAVGLCRRRRMGRGDGCETCRDAVEGSMWETRGSVWGTGGVGAGFAGECGRLRQPGPLLSRSLRGRPESQRDLNGFPGEGLGAFRGGGLKEERKGAPPGRSGAIACSGRGKGENFFPFAISFFFPFSSFPFFFFPLSLFFPLFFFFLPPPAPPCDPLRVVTYPGKRQGRPTRGYIWVIPG